MQMRRAVAITATAAAMILAATCAQAQTFDISKDRLQLIVRDLLEKAEKEPGGNAGLVLERYHPQSDEHSINLTARVKSGGGEIHQKFTDIFYVLDGEATMVTGGSIADVKIDPATGEGRGEKVVGGVEQVLHKGDMFHIPAGTPHQTIVAKGKKFEYICVKVGLEKGAPPTKSAVDYWSAAQLEAAGESTLASAKAAANGSGNTTLVRYDSHFINVTARVKSATTSELHGHYTDLFIVLSGEMTEVTGGWVPDQKIDAATGEGHGGNIQKGTTTTLHAGDLLHIDPATNHQSLMEPNKEFAAIVIKLHHE